MWRRSYGRRVRYRSVSKKELGPSCNTFRLAKGLKLERANRSVRIEFLSLYDRPLTVISVTPRLNDHEFFYN